MKGGTCFFYLFIFAMIGIGGYFIFIKPVPVSPKPTEKQEIIKQFTPKELAKLAKLSEKKFTQYFYELGASDKRYLYYGNSQDELSFDQNISSAPSIETKPARIEYTYSLANKHREDFYTLEQQSFISLFVQNEKPQYFYWQFSKKKLYNEALASFKNLATTQLPDEITEYKLDATSYVADLGFHYESKTYALKIYDKPVIKQSKQPIIMQKKQEKIDDNPFDESQ